MANLALFPGRVTKGFVKFKEYMTNLGQITCNNCACNFISTPQDFNIFVR